MFCSVLRLLEKKKKLLTNRSLNTYDNNVVISVCSECSLWYLRVDYGLTVNLMSVININPG